MKEGSRTKYTILGMLGESPASGYEISKRIEGSTNYFWSESEGQIYPALAQCLKEGLVACKEEQATKSKQNKKIYSITTRGRKVLKEWLKKEPKNTLLRNELLLKLFFGGYTDIADNIRHLQNYQKKLEKELLSYEEIYERLSREWKKSPNLKYWLLSLDYGLKLTKAELAWCKDSLKLFI